MEVNILEKLNDIVSNPNKYTEKERSSAFPLLKLYRNPVSALGDNSDHIYNGNSQIPCYNNFILNNDFICLVDFGLQDPHFKEKATDNVFDKIRSIIDDSISSYEDNPVENKDFNIELARKLSKNLLYLLSKNINFLDLFSGIAAIKKNAKEYYLGLIESETYLKHLFAFDNGMFFFDIERAQDLIQKLHIKLNEIKSK